MYATASARTTLLALTAMLGALGCKRPKPKDDTKGLDALPYLAEAPVDKASAGKVGVTLNTPLAQPGHNLYASRSGHGATLMDLEGNVVRRWTSNLAPGPWGVVEYDPQRKELYAIAADTKLLRIADDGEARVVIENAYVHHDIEVLPDGSFWTITGGLRGVRRTGLLNMTPVLDDRLALYGRDGTEVRSISVYDLVGHLVPKTALERIRRLRASRPKANLVDYWKPPGVGVIRVGPGSAFDVLHTNTVEVLKQPIKGVADVGDLLFSVRELNLVGIVNPESQKLLWSWGPGKLQAQHQPTLLPNGNILVFDNGYRRRYSRVVEVDPKARKIVWQYGVGKGERFFSARRSNAQKLANGNLLVALGDTGEVFEVTPEGKRVWEWHNPDVRKARKGVPKEMRGAIYRMHRLPVPPVEPAHAKRPLPEGSGR